MTKPKWILANELVIGTLRLDRFPVPCALAGVESFKSEITGWCQLITLHLTIKDRSTGDPGIFSIAVRLVKNTNLASELRRKLIESILHEVDETIQFEDLDGKRMIPFDPHPRYDMDSI